MGPAVEQAGSPRGQIPQQGEGGGRRLPLEAHHGRARRAEGAGGGQDGRVLTGVNGPSLGTATSVALRGGTGGHGRAERVSAANVARDTGGDTGSARNARTAASTSGPAA
ncbi:conserved hypothetical protein [Streptomyces pristinaespiralis ATCC 25486]|uniref:Uncharacterized protein n=1 Tax=Streptomyces pristinaespiralis (strain ATCC 25486 / DSM 40338 / CBS 914.69 / JCM 4507 / KCC S-0507 / NBRC 13074 / NRRL 2958 / 5647) TaxID=457429 RepID=B5H8N5_STRE2|nr:conserved hypothetical protein [Streptomyces pristinaespiralis ATCC 25486]